MRRFVVRLALAALVSTSAAAPALAQEAAKTGEVVGVVTIDGAPAVGMELDMMPSGVDEPRRAVTGADGRYRFEGVSAGPHVIIANQCGLIRVDEGRASGVALNVDVAAGAVAEADALAFTPGGVLSGRVLDVNGAPAARECVTAIRVDANGRPIALGPDEPRLEGATRGDGSYSLCGLAPGRYVVRAGCDRASLVTGGRAAERPYYPGVSDVASAAPVEVVAGASVDGIDFALRTSAALRAISGRVVDGVSGEPVAGLVLSLGMRDEGGSSSQTQGMTDADGAFRIAGLRPGTYMISPAPQGETAARYIPRPVDVKVGAGDASVVVRLERAASVSGTVIVENADAPGAREALREARVRPLEVPMVAPGVVLWMEFPRVAGDGTFRLGGLTGGRVRLMLAEGNRVFWVRRVEVDGRDVSGGLDLAPGEQVSGAKIVVVRGTSAIRVRVDFRGVAVPRGIRFHVSAEPAGGWDAATQPALYADAPDVDGAFVVDGLVAGEYVVTPWFAPTEPNVEPLDVRAEPVRVTVGDAATADVTLVVAPPK